jgi:hypothetical protein
MESFVGVLRVNDATIVSTDVMTEDTLSPNLFSINKFNLAVLLGDLGAGTSFCQKYLKSFESLEGGFDQIINEARESLEKNVSDYSKKLMTISFIGYETDFRERPYYVLRFDGQRINYNVYPADNKLLFSINNDLAAYIISKVYSSHMSLDKAVNLMGYISAQYNRIFSTGKYFSLITISKDGLSWLDRDRIKSVMSKAEEIDVSIRKHCCNFFMKDFTSGTSL